MLFAKTGILVLIELRSSVSIGPGCNTAGEVNSHEHRNENYSAVDSKVLSGRLICAPVCVEFQDWYNEDVCLYQQVEEKEG